MPQYRLAPSLDTPASIAQTRRMKAAVSPGLPHPQTLSLAWLATLLAASCAFLCSSHTAWGWGSEGHQVVAQIAYNHLSSAAQTKCDALLTVTVACGGSGDTFVTASTWADTYKSCLGTGSEHYIDLAFVADSNYSLTNGYTVPAPNVVTALNWCITTLTNSSSTQSNQAAALRYLIHFTGDITQPLHASDGFYAAQPTGDAGGNGFKITGTWNNLHSLWDAGGGYLTDGLTVAQKVAAIETDYPYTPNPGTIPNPMDWANECYPIAVTNAYVGITYNTSPSSDYLNRAKATTEQRMAIGGHRLADLLNTIYGKAAATVTLSPLAQTYTGTARSVTATTSPSGLTVNLTYNGSTSAPTNAGSYTVIGTINDSSYQGSTNGTLIINPAAATVTLGNLAQTYNGTARAASATTAPPGLTVNLTYNGSANAPTNAGSYAVIGTASDPNYQGSTNATLVVGKAAATVTLSNLSQTYDGTAKSVTATTSPSSLAVTLTYNGLATAPTNTGSYTVLGTVNDLNYQGSATNTLVITEPPPIVLSGPAMLRGVGFGFTFTNLPGLTFTVLSATNPVYPLNTWAFVGSATEVSPGQYHFSDPQATNQSYLFYRVRLP